MSLSGCGTSHWITFATTVKTLPKCAKLAYSWEIETRDTLDISCVLRFEFINQFDTPYESYPKAKAKIGRFLGRSNNIGQAL